MQDTRDEAFDQVERDILGPEFTWDLEDFDIPEAVTVEALEVRATVFAEKEYQEMLPLIWGETWTALRGIYTDVEGFGCKFTFCHTLGFFKMCPEGALNHAFMQSEVVRVALPQEKGYISIRGRMLEWVGEKVVCVRTAELAAIVLQRALTLPDITHFTAEIVAKQTRFYFVVGFTTTLFNDK